MAFLEALMVNVKFKKKNMLLLSSPKEHTFICSLQYIQRKQTCHVYGVYNKGCTYPSGQSSLCTGLLCHHFNIQEFLPIIISCLPKTCLLSVTLNQQTSLHDSFLQRSFGNISINNAIYFFPTTMLACAPRVAQVV